MQHNLSTKINEIHTRATSKECSHLFDQVIFTGVMETIQQLQSQTYDIMMCKLCLVTYYTSDSEEAEKLAKEELLYQLRYIQKLPSDPLKAYKAYPMFHLELTHVLKDFDQRCKIIEFGMQRPLLVCSSLTLKASGDGEKKPAGIRGLLLKVAESTNSEVILRNQLLEIDFPNGREDDLDKAVKPKNMHLYIKDILAGSQTTSQGTSDRRRLLDVFEKQCESSRQKSLSDTTLPSRPNASKPLHDSARSSTPSSSWPKRASQRDEGERSKPAENKRKFFARPKGNSAASFNFITAQQCRDINSLYELEIVDLSTQEETFLMNLQPRAGPLSQYSQETSGKEQAKPVCLIMLMKGFCNRPSCSFDHSKSALLKGKADVEKRWSTELITNMHNLHFMQEIPSLDIEEDDIDTTASDALHAFVGTEDVDPF